MSATPSNEDKRITLKTLRRWVESSQRFAMLTCYDATTAKLFWQAGVKVMLVGDSAGQVILGHDSTIPATMPFMLEITKAVRRGAPKALIMADMPFGSYHCGDDAAMQHAVSFVKDADADLVKLEVDADDAGLVHRMSRAGVPVVAHIGSRPQHYKAEGGYVAAGREDWEVELLVETASRMIEAGATALLLEAVPDVVSRRVVERAIHPATGKVVPVIGCGAGPLCHGHVVVMQDIMGMTSWQPAFAKPLASVGDAMKDAAARYVEQVEKGEYLKDGSPYG